MESWFQLYTNLVSNRGNGKLQRASQFANSEETYVKMDKLLLTIETWIRTSRSVCSTQIKQSLRLFIPSRLKPTHHSGSTHILCYSGHSSSQLLQHWFQSCDHIQDLPQSSLKLLLPSSLLNCCSPSLPPFLLLSTLFYLKPNSNLWFYLVWRTCQSSLY